VKLSSNMFTSRAPIMGLIAIAGGLATSAHAQCALGQSPEGLAFDEYGFLWVASYDTNSVYNFVPDNGYTLASGGTSYTSSNITSGLSGPTRLTITGEDEVFTTNSSGNSVEIYYDYTGGSQTLYGVSRPLGIALVNGYFLVAENATSQIAAYSYPYFESGGAASSDAEGHPFWAPGALTVSGQNLYVATNDGTVHSYNAVNFLDSLLNNNSSLRQEIHNYSDSTSGGPTGIAIDAAGNVWVAYYYSSDVVKYSSSGQKLLKITGGVSQPEGIAIEPSTGYVYVANTGTHNVTIFSSSGSFVSDFSCTFQNNN
jgi:DNA-binding beta-propeller fold protein YncE